MPAEPVYIQDTSGTPAKMKEAAMCEVSTNSCAGATSSLLVVDALHVSFLTSRSSLYT